MEWRWHVELRKPTKRERDGVYSTQDDIDDGCRMGTHFRGGVRGDTLHSECASQASDGRKDET